MRGGRNTPEIKAKLNALTIDQVGELLTQLGSRVGESYSDSAMMLMMHCGTLASPLVEVAPSPDVHFPIAQDFSDLENKGPRVVVVFVNSAITNMMKRNTQYRAG